MAGGDVSLARFVADLTFFHQQKTLVLSAAIAGTKLILNVEMASYADGSWFAVHADCLQSSYDSGIPEFLLIFWRSHKEQ